MKDEIKEILDKFDKVLENYELDKKFGQMSVDSICHLFPSEMIIIKDYITNLQEELKNKNKIIKEYLDNIREIAEKLGKVKGYINTHSLWYKDNKDAFTTCNNEILYLMEDNDE